MFWFAKAAAVGIIGNIAWDSFKRIAEKVRTRDLELFPTKLDFPSVVPKETYKKLRLKKHGSTHPKLKAPAEFEKELKLEYGAMIPRKKSNSKENRPKKKTT